jgi:hypothetical protein
MSWTRLASTANELLLIKPKVHCRVHKNPLLDPTLDITFPSMNKSSNMSLKFVFFD